MKPDKPLRIMEVGYKGEFPSVNGENIFFCPGVYHTEFRNDYPRYRKDIRKGYNCLVFDIVSMFGDLKRNVSELECKLGQFAIVLNRLTFSFDQRILFGVGTLSDTLSIPFLEKILIYLTNCTELNERINFFVYCRERTKYDGIEQVDTTAVKLHVPFIVILNSNQDACLNGEKQICNTCSSADGKTCLDKLRNYKLRGFYFQDCNTPKSVENISIFMNKVKESGIC